MYRQIFKETREGFLDNSEGFKKKLSEEEFDAYVNAIFPSNKTKESEKQMEDRKMWAMYDVIMVDKDTLNIVVNESVVAKSAEHAKGIAGVYDKLEEKNFDDTRFVVKVAHIADIKPIEDDEK